MCSSNETVSLVLVAVFAATAIRAGLLQQRFARGLRAAEPAAWADISTWHRWNENSELHESAVASYILQGRFWALQEEVLVGQALQCRRWYFASFLILFFVGVHSSLTGVFAPIGCLWVRGG